MQSLLMLYGSMTRVPEVISAFLRQEPVQQVADASPGRFGGSPGGVAQQVFGHGEDLFNRIEVRTAGWKKQQAGTGRYHDRPRRHKVRPAKHTSRRPKFLDSTDHRFVGVATTSRLPRGFSRPPVPAQQAARLPPPARPRLHEPRQLCRRGGRQPDAPSSSSLQPSRYRRDRRFDRHRPSPA